ncbi:hypothetical protein H6P81_011289 [Aristolochia fimbriata]|uniref:Uncharacterized protein n=1 Tax=Aristolochia fimbriata TaxID=158543 RepID=A0AAV7ERW9_ARIFI|nr:hypothetical protein H6P81_011289 [Aristolochia fimbriata]
MMKSQFLLLLSAFLLAAAQDFDFFYFVQQWPASYCDTKRSCCYPKSGKPEADFGIHGLWPNYNGGSYPSNCDPDSPFHPSTIANLTSEMGRKWPSLTCPSSDGLSFWEHEWEKHGTCSESVLTQYQYFQTALNLKQKANLLQILQDAGIKPNGGFYTTEAISEAIREGLGYAPGIQCNVDKGGNRQLYQIFLCVDTSGTDFIDCPVMSKSARCDGLIEFPPFSSGLGPDHQEEEYVERSQVIRNMKSHFSLLLLSAFLHLTLSAALSSAQDFDFFYFVQQWPGSYCDTKRSCCYPKSGKPESDFGIHGLWPNYNDGSYPSNCDPDSPFHPSTIANLTSEMAREWPTLSCPSSDGLRFWEHEWEKHGTCSESLLSQYNYFQTALNLKHRANLLQILQQAGIEPDGGFYRKDAISEAIEQGIGYTPGVECNVDEGGNRQLYQIYLCVDPSGSDFIHCPVLPRQKCGERIEFPVF